MRHHSTAASILNAVGIDFRLNTPLDENNPNVFELPGEFPGHVELLDGNGNDALTAHAYDSSLYTLLDDNLYTLWDGSGTDVITVEHGARLRIITDDDLNSSNTVKLVDFKSDDLTLRKPTLSDDLTVQMDLNLSFLVVESLSRAMGEQHYE